MSFSPDRIDRSRLPRHVGVIMDGNGRWAEARGLSRIEGHQQGVRRVRELIEFSAELGVQYLTLYVFSLENWRRPRSEVSALMHILGSYLQNEVQSLVEMNVRFRAVGNHDRLPANLRRLLEDGERRTANGTAMTLVAALSYGGRDEIVRAVRRIVASGMPADAINEEVLADALDTRGIPDPDLVIRTSGEIRLSNFLTWQSAYSELYFTEMHWPDFDREAFLRALEDYSQRERRFGALPVRKG